LAAWRRALPPKKWPWLSSALSLAQCESQLRAHPGSVAAVSIEADNLPLALEALHRWRGEFRQARFLALVSEEIAQSGTAAALLQEAGALLVIAHARELPAAARLVARHFRRHVATQLPLRTAVWQRLPWSQYASPATTPNQSTLN
jgi:hypothetical protein